MRTSDAFLDMERSVQAELPDYEPALIAEVVADHMGFPVETDERSVRIYVRGKPGSGIFLERRR